MKQTPLHARHIGLGARMAPFGGWDMPIQYAGILQEHAHTRTRCSVFDICHMGELDFRGPTATADLERLVTQNVTTLQDGQCRYGFMLRDDGGVLDDLTCYRFAADHYMLVVNAATCQTDIDWIRDQLSPDTTFTDRSCELAKLDLQGPTTREDMEKVLKAPLPELKYFHAVWTKLAGTECLVSRTGYTGEWGYELYFPASEVGRLWDLFLANENIKPAGLGARDTLRLEMGYPLYGHELSLRRTPVPACRGSFIEMNKAFAGRAAVAQDLAQGTPDSLVGLELEGRRAARAHDTVLFEGKAVGGVTSGSFAPSMGKAVALAYVHPDLSKAGQTLEISVHGQPLPATVVTLPFYKNGTARKKS